MQTITYIFISRRLIRYKIFAFVLLFKSFREVSGFRFPGFWKKKKDGERSVAQRCRQVSWRARRRHRLAAAAAIKAVQSIRESGRVTLGAFFVARGFSRSRSVIYIRARARSATAGRCEKEKRNGEAARAKDDGATCDLTSKEGSARWEKCPVEYHGGWRTKWTSRYPPRAQPCVCEPLRLVLFFFFSPFRLSLSLFLSLSVTPFLRPLAR